MPKMIEERFFKIFKCISNIFQAFTLTKCRKGLQVVKDEKLKSQTHAHTYTECIFLYVGIDRRKRIQAYIDMLTWFDVNSNCFSFNLSHQC